MKNKARFFALLGLSATLILPACESVETEAKYPTGAERSSTGGDIYAKPESIFGDGGLFSLGKDKDDGGDSVIGVNSFLWRAALDTVSFMPLASADPFGGVILTDWYTPADNTAERFKVNVFILGRQLRSDGIRVRAFKQNLVKGNWVDSPTDSQTAAKLEDAILARARQLRIAKLGEIED